MENPTNYFKKIKLQAISQQQIIHIDLIEESVAHQMEIQTGRLQEHKILKMKGKRLSSKRNHIYILAFDSDTCI